MAILSGHQAIHLLDDVRIAVCGGAPVTPSLERQVQEVLAALRCSSDAENLNRAERVSTALFTLVQAKRNGRLNLYASQLLRLAQV
jgi:hypothetical protein